MGLDLLDMDVLDSEVFGNVPELAPYIGVRPGRSGTPRVATEPSMDEEGAVAVNHDLTGSEPHRDQCCIDLGGVDALGVLGARGVLGERIEIMHWMQSAD